MAFLSLHKSSQKSIKKPKNAKKGKPIFERDNKIFTTLKVKNIWS